MVLNRSFWRHVLPSVFVFAAFASCEESRKDILPKEKMQAVLLDINVAEVYSAMSEDSTHPRGEKNPDSLALYYKPSSAIMALRSRDSTEAWRGYKTHPRRNGHDCEQE